MGKITYLVLIASFSALCLFTVWNFNAARIESDKALIAELKTHVERLGCPACVAGAVANIIAEKGMTHGFHIVKSWYETLPSQRKDCHYLTMEIGNTMASTTSDFRSLSLTPESIWCDYGFYHSFARALFERTGSLEAAADFCTYASDTLAYSAKDAGPECFRGLGQSLPFIDPAHEGNARAMSESALDICERITRNDTQYLRCAAGVFFSIGEAMSSKEHGLSVSSTNPLWLCSFQKNPVLNACRSNLVKNGVLSIAKAYPDASIAEQYQAVEGLYAGLSAREVPEMMWVLAYEKARKNAHLEDLIPLAHEECAPVSKLYANECVQGFAFSIAKHGIPSEQQERVLSFCERISRVIRIDTVRCVGKAVIYLAGMKNPSATETLCADVRRALGVTCEDVGELIPSL